MSLTRTQAPFIKERRSDTTGRPVPTQVRLRPRDFGRADAGILAACAAASYCLVWILFYQLTLLSGTVGFVLCTLVVFLVLHWLVHALVNGRRVAADRTLGALVSVGALCLFSSLALVVGFLFAKGFSLLSWHLLTGTQKGVEETCLPGFPCTKPGVFHAIVGTLEQTALAALMGVPAGVLTAIYLNEIRGRFSSVVRIVVTAMSGLPAILAGAFVYSFWIEQFHQGFSGFAGSIALAVLLLPLVTRGTEEVLRIVPNDLREASTALAAPQWRTVWSVVLPTARSGLITAVLLGIAVVLGETAPLILTIFGNTALNPNPFSHPQAALSLLSYREVQLPLQTDKDLAYASALVLFIMIFVIFILARILASEWLGNRFRSVLNRRMVAAATRAVTGEKGEA